jgi:putative oxidoreductase
VTRRLRRLLGASPGLDKRNTVALVGRIAAGVVFLGFGAAKFVNHGTEADSFEAYGLPAPDALVYVIGALEVLGGLLLLAGLGTRAAALVLAGDMVAAIIVSGVARGEVISLTLAPVLLTIMLYLLSAKAARPARSPG